MSNDERLYKILDKMDQRLDNVDITLAKQSVILEEHIKRTELLEEKLEDDVEPLKDHARKINGILWALSGILGLVLAAKGLGLF